MDNLASLQQTFDAKAFRQAVATLRSASEIVVAGMRSTHRSRSTSGSDSTK
jgi:DNA-binding MurR/RpiR family transcriptional regulator